MYSQAHSQQLGVSLASMGPYPTHSWSPPSLTASAPTWMGPSPPHSPAPTPQALSPAPQRGGMGGSPSYVPSASLVPPSPHRASVSSYAPSPVPSPVKMPPSPAKLQAAPVVPALPTTTTVSARGTRVPAGPMRGAVSVPVSPAKPASQSASVPQSPKVPQSPQKLSPLPVARMKSMEDEVEPEVLEIFKRIDGKGDGWFSKLDFFAAISRDEEVYDFVLGGGVGGDLFADEKTYDTVDGLFEGISENRSRVTLAQFAEHFRRAKAEKTPRVRELREIFNRIDADGSGFISKLEFVAAMQQDPVVDEFILPGVDSSQVMNDEWSFNAVDASFQAIANGKKRIEFRDFERYFLKGSVCGSPVTRSDALRSETRVLIIGPGFGREMNPFQGRMIEDAGFQVHWVSNIPNPEQANFQISHWVGQIMAEINWFQPDVVACGSKGGVYIVALWQMGFWRGPTVLINAHPSCKRLPENVPVVLCHGGNDEVYPTPRAELEKLVATGTPNLCFLYYCANSGEVSPGMVTRNGDMHNMESLLYNDCLPRLVDAVMCPQGPELHMMRTWRRQVSASRLEAERWLGSRPERLRERWQSRGRKGRDEQLLFEVVPGTEEYERVRTVFKAAPKEKPAYVLNIQERWDAVRVVKVERVENGLQMDGSFAPYFDSVERSLEDQEVSWEPGAHTRWALHGADSFATESILTNPVAGFQPLASGSRGAALWGGGTYFARDAAYVADSHFCGQPAADGTRQMLLCLLTVGMPCLGDPNHRGVLPMRRRPHRYNSSVDSLSAPEIYVVQHPGAAYPAYLVTFA